MYSNALLVKAAEMYYTRHSSQKEIAQHLGVSAATVSRILQEAVEQGVVRVRIVDTANRSLELAARLSERFGLERAEIIDSGHDRDAWKLKSSSARRRNASFPNSVLRGVRSASASGGTIFEMIESLESGAASRRIARHSAHGRFGDAPPERETNAFVSTMGSALNCTFSIFWPRPWSAPPRRARTPSSRVADRPGDGPLGFRGHGHIFDRAGLETSM
jgi:DNA-binding transcriptional regulator LsrR (DeoR family)